MLLVPLSAVAAVALVNPDATAEPEDVAVAVVAETTTTAAAEEIVIPEIASGDDLELACGEQGQALVVKEGEATISPLEQAALDSLRAICLAEGMELPGPPAPEAVVQTVTVVAAPASSGSGTDTVDSADTAAAEFEAEYAATVAHINKAIADGAGGEKIAKAERLVIEAAALADAGNYGDGMKKLSEARKAADDAERGHHDDDDDDDDHDDDDHDDDDDDHDDDDDDDDEDEEDEEDEKDDH
jgi:hypothetical protein